MTRTRRCNDYESNSLGKQSQEAPDDDDDDLEWIHEVKECPVYHPSKEEFEEDPLDYLRKIAPEASKYGICKIVPPLSLSVPVGIVLTKEKRGFKFTTRVQPLKLSEWGRKHKHTFYERGRKYSLCDFESMANKATASRYCVSGCLPSAYVEREFWHELTVGKKKKTTVEYGINVEGSAFSCSCNDGLGSSKWNLNTLPRLPNSTLRLVENPIPGVTDPMLYIGMLFSMFAWHVEDHYLYSINYHHCGAPKTWYGVPSYAAFEFEEVAEHCIYTRQSDDGVDGAFDLLADKTTMFSPQVLLQHRVPVYKAVQHPGEFVITFPRAYHAGFSHGFNCGEAVNFATDDWFPFGAEATQRYSRISRMPIVPYEQLLCKAAALLSTTTSSHHAAMSSHFVKVCFARLIRLHQYARLRLKRLHKLLRIAPKLEGTIFCSACKRDCYLACFSCNCSADPICLFHETEVSKCSCGRNCVLSLRGDVTEMEAMARKFEEEEGLLSEELQMKHENLSANEGCRDEKKSCGGVVERETADDGDHTEKRFRKRRRSSGVRGKRRSVVAVMADAAAARKEAKRSSQVRGDTILANENKWSRLRRTTDLRR